MSNFLADFFTLIVVSHPIRGHQPSATTFKVALCEFCNFAQLGLKHRFEMKGSDQDAKLEANTFVGDTFSVKWKSRLGF